MQALVFFPEKMKNFEVVPQNKTVKEKLKICLLDLMDRRNCQKKIILDIACTTANVYVNRPLAPVELNCWLHHFKLKCLQ